MTNFTDVEEWKFSFTSSPRKEVWARDGQPILKPKPLPKEEEEELPDLTGLTVQQRYIYQYFLYHKSKRTGKPIPVPVYVGRLDKIHKFFTALKRLEERGLIVVDRRASNYKGWTINGPR